MRKRKIILLVLLILIANMSISYSSWYDWSRYEEGIYSFKIPEGFEVKYTSSVQPQDYLSGDIGTINVFFDSEPGIEIINAGYHSDTKEILKYNNTTSFHTTTTTNDFNNTTDYHIIGAYKVTNDTYLQISLHPYEYNNKTIEQGINIINGMFESLEINK